MIWGDPWTTFWGENESYMKTFEIIDNGDGLGARVKMRAIPDAAQNWALVTDGVLTDVVSVLDDADVFGRAIYDQNRIEHLISASPLGGWNSTLDIDVITEHENFAEDKGRSVKLSWDAVLEDIESFGDNSQLTAWSFAGVSRFNNVSRHLENLTQAKVNIELTTASGTHTLNLYQENTLVATGSRVGDGVLTFSEVSSSGLSGSVTLAFSAAFALSAEAFVVMRFASSYEIHFNSVLSFPRDPEGTVIDDGFSSSFSFILDDQAITTFDFLIRAISDTEKTSSNTAAQGTVIIPGRPEAPTGISLVSGNALATFIRFTSSSTAGATYRLYDSELNLATDFLTVATTYPNFVPSTLETVQLPAIAVGAGKRTITLVALSGGSEDTRRLTLEIEYDSAGNVVFPRPNDAMGRISTRNEKTLTVDFTYHGVDEAATPDTMQLFLFADGDDETDFSSPAATLAIAPGEGGTVTGQISATASVNGWYTWAVKAFVSSSMVQSESASTEGPEYLSDVVPAAPANVEAKVIT